VVLCLTLQLKSTYKIPFYRQRGAAYIHVWNEKEQDMKSRLKGGLLSGFAVLALSALASQQEATACQPGAYVGSLCVTTANFCPREYQPAFGQLLDINQYTMTYAVMGNTYGGNGVNDFGVPHVAGREFVHEGQAPGLEYIQRGEYMGVEKFHLPYLYMPEHTHTLNLSNMTIQANVTASSAGATLNSPESNIFAGTSGAANYNATANKTLKAGSVTATLTLHPNSTSQTPETQSFMSLIGPQTGLTVCIAVDGAYPPRP